MQNSNNEHIAKQVRNYNFDINFICIDNYNSTL